MTQYRSHGTCCAICGNFVGKEKADYQEGLCISCLTGLKACRKAFSSPDVIVSALAYLEIHLGEDAPLTREGMKRCARCEKLLPLTDFYHYKGKPISYCRPCNSAYHVSYLKKKQRR